MLFYDQNTNNMNSTMPKTQSRSETNVVCIGASAGGLEAIETFFKNCPNDFGASYVVIQHLSSSYKSMMDDLINRYTSMPIKMIKSGMHVESDTVYLIEAGTTIALSNNVFVVEQKNDGSLTLPIDIFLQSLQQNELNKVIAIVLSGTGSDGSRGALSVNAMGGFVIAQEPSEAGFDGMPNSVMSTGVVDHVLSAKDMPNMIARYLTMGVKPVAKAPKVAQGEDLSAPAQLKRILDKLNDEYGINFNLYKEATVERRVERRMQVKHIPDFHAYANFIESDPVEPMALRSELLIPVTNFFRDEAAFSHLKSMVIDKLVESSSGSDELRIWVAGCSTGEEAYSIAMLFDESIHSHNKNCSFKVFATDVNPDVINTASQGIYPDAILTEVPQNYIDEYFSKDGNQLNVKSKIRDKVVFAVHNLLTDAPFTKMDLVSCRNTLIYFKSEAQLEAMQRLQHAVKEGRYLFLGKSESLVTNIENFKLLDRKNKLFSCIRRSTNLFNNLNFSVSRHGSVPVSSSTVKPMQVNKAQYDAERLIKREFTPLSILVNNSFEVIHVYGEDTGLLQIKPGALNNHIGNLLPEKLSPVALALIYRLNKEDGKVSSDIVQVNENNQEPRFVKLIGWAIKQDDLPAYYAISLLEKEQLLTSEGGEPVDVNQVNTDRINQLEIELHATRESLQSTIEELETTNEELQSTNEELMASNEELQSSNEELQSVNEELNTVNAEYHEKMSELNQINADLDVMSSSTGFASVFVDADVCVTRFTPDAQSIFRIREQDHGRPLDEIVHNLIYPELFEDIARVIATGKTKEREIKAETGSAYIAKLMSYEVPSQNQYGAVISFIETKGFGSFQAVMNSVPQHIAVLDKHGEIMLVNRAWQRFANLNATGNEAELLGVGINYLDVCKGADDDMVKKGVESVLSGQALNFSHKYPCHSPTEKRWFVMTVEPILHEEYKAVVTHTNVTKWEQ